MSFNIHEHIHTTNIFGWCGGALSTSVLLKIGSSQGFQEMKMCGGGSVLLALLNLYVWIKIREATLNTNHSVTGSMQSITASIQKLPDPVVKSSRAHDTRSMCQVKRSGYQSVW